MNRAALAQHRRIYVNDALAAPAVGFMIDFGIDPKAVWQIGLAMMLIPSLMFLFLKPHRRTESTSND